MSYSRLGQPANSNLVDILRINLERGRCVATAYSTRTTCNNFIGREKLSCVRSLLDEGTRLVFRGEPLDMFFFEQLADCLICYQQKHKAQASGIIAKWRRQLYESQETRSCVGAPTILSTEEREKIAALLDEIRHDLRILRKENTDEDRLSVPQPSHREISDAPSTCILSNKPRKIAVGSKMASISVTRIAPRLASERVIEDCTFASKTPPETKPTIRSNDVCCPTPEAIKKTPSSTSKRPAIRDRNKLIGSTAPGITSIPVTHASGHDTREATAPVPKTQSSALIFETDKVTRASTRATTQASGLCIKNDSDADCTSPAPKAAKESQLTLTSKVSECRARCMDPCISTDVKARLQQTPGFAARAKQGGESAPESATEEASSMPGDVLLPERLPVGCAKTGYILPLAARIDSTVEWPKTKDSFTQTSWSMPAEPVEISEETMLLGRGYPRARQIFATVWSALSRCARTRLGKPGARATEKMIEGDDLC